MLDLYVKTEKSTYKSVGSWCFIGTKKKNSVLGTYKASL